MPRRGFIPKREVLPDPVYGTTVVTKLINQVMYDGKRGVAQAVVYSAFETVANKTGKEAIEVFNQAIANIMPSLEVKARRVGGTTYQVPIEIRPERRQTLALRREAPRGYAQDGRGQQGVRALSLVVCQICIAAATFSTLRRAESVYARHVKFFDDLLIKQL